MSAPIKHTECPISWAVIDATSKGVPSRSFRAALETVRARLEGRVLAPTDLIWPNERCHAGDQKTPQVLIAHLGDPTEALLAAGGVVQRRQPEPSRELTPGA